MGKKNDVLVVNLYLHMRHIYEYFLVVLVWDSNVMSLSNSEQCASIQSGARIIPENRNGTQLRQLMSVLSFHCDKMTLSIQHMFH